MSLNPAQQTVTSEINTSPSALGSTESGESVANYSFITHSAIPSLVSAALIFIIVMLLPNDRQESPKPGPLVKVISVSSAAIK